MKKDRRPWSRDLKQRKRVVKSDDVKEAAKGEPIE